MVVEKEPERNCQRPILIEDMEQVIEHCEREDRGIIDPEIYIGRASEHPAGPTGQSTRCR